MLFPKKVKHRKWQTMRRNPKKVRLESRGLTLAFGSHGMKALTPGRITAKQLEAARKTIMHEVKKSGKLWIRVFPDMPYTAKPAEVGMGKGKGDPQGYECVVWPGRVLFEVDGTDDLTARAALRKGGAKLPLKTKVLARGV